MVEAVATKNDRWMLLYGNRSQFAAAAAGNHWKLKSDTVHEHFWHRSLGSLGESLVVVVSDHNSPSPPPPPGGSDTLPVTVAFSGEGIKFPQKPPATTTMGDPFELEWHDLDATTTTGDQPRGSRDHEPLLWPPTKPPAALAAPTTAAARL